MPLSIPLANRFFKPKQEPIPGINVSREVEKKKIKESRKGGRKSIIALFALTVFASLFFYLKTEIPLLWQKISSPVVVSNLPSPSAFNPSPVISEIENLVLNLRGEYGVFVYHLNDKQQYGIKANEAFTAASLIKLPVMMATYQEAEAGRLNLETYRSKLEAMGKRSDNSAFNSMVKILGQAKIQATIDNLGMKNTSFARNETTPADIGLFFQKLYKGDLISNEHKNEFLSFLTDTSNEERIPSGVPAGTRVAHKIGTELGSFSDAGIIYASPPAGGFILVIMSDDAREAEAKIVLPQIAKAVWEFENK